MKSTITSLKSLSTSVYPRMCDMNGLYSGIRMIHSKQVIVVIVKYPGVFSFTAFCILMSFIDGNSTLEPLSCLKLPPRFFMLSNPANKGANALSEKLNPFSLTSAIFLAYSSVGLILSFLYKDSCCKRTEQTLLQVLPF